MNIKQKVRIKITNEYRYFLKSNIPGVNRMSVLVYLNRGNDGNDLKLKYIIYQKVLSRIITSYINTSKIVID